MPRLPAGDIVWRRLSETGGQLILDILPELERITGPQSPVPTLFGTAAQDRFNQCFKNLIQVFADADHPLTIFLDDLQWADSASLQFLNQLMQEAEVHHLLVIGAYRDHEVDGSHPLALVLNDLQTKTEILQTLVLSPLRFETLNQLIAATLHCSWPIATPLTELVLQKTGGSPFFVTQFLQYLYDRQLLTYNPQGGHWQFDIAKVRALVITNDVVGLLVKRLRQLAQETQTVVSIAACLGNQFDLKTLAIVCDRSVWETATDLWPALQEGLLLPTSEVYKFFQGSVMPEVRQTALPMPGPEPPVPHYRFLHDRVQQAAYSLIPTAEHETVHLTIAQRLLAHLNAEQQETHIFALVRHLNLAGAAAAAIVAPETIARLNLLAGRRAKASAAYESAAVYCQTARTHLRDRSWVDQYDLAFNIAFESLQVEYLVGHYQVAEAMARQLLQTLQAIPSEEDMTLVEGDRGPHPPLPLGPPLHAAPFLSQPQLDSARVYDFLVQFYGVQNRMSDAVEAGLQALEILGMTLAEAVPLSLVKDQIPLPTVDQVPDLPLMGDPAQQLGLQILMNLCTPGFATDPTLYRRIMLTMLYRCQHYGYAAPAAHAYVSYGMSLCGEAAEFDLGYRAGQLGLCLVERFQAKALKVKANLIVNGQIHHWHAHLADTVAGLEAGIHAGIDLHDVEFATYCLNFIALHTCRTADSLETALTYQARLLNLKHIKIFEQATPLYYTRIWHQFLLNLMAVPEHWEAANPVQLVGSAFDETRALPYLYQVQVRVSLAAFYVAKTILGYAFEQYDVALQAAETAVTYLAGLTSTLLPLHNAYYSLVLLAIASTAPIVSEQTPLAQRLAQVDRNQRQLQQWAKAAPMNYSHLYQLVEAERHRVLNDPLAAMSAYDAAIAQAEAHHYVGDAALAYECAARFYACWGKPMIAQTYGVNAYYAYARWGARAKVAWLETHYAEQLGPALPQSTAIATAPQNRHLDNGPRFHAPSERLDLHTLMQTARILSQEIQVEKLLAALLKVIRENAGAEKCALMLTQGDRLLLKAHSLHQTCQFLDQPVASSAEVPLSVINYVAHTYQTLLSNAVASEPRFAADPYILQHQPQSLLCLPLLNQGKLIGMVYLENTLTANVFTDQRLEVINLLCAQAAISLDIAGLYEQEQQQQQELREKNLALEQAIDATEAAKAEIIRLNQDLERRIQLRTAELEATNHHLQQQIAERQEAQQRLQESELQFASILSGLDEVVWSISVETGQVLYLNPAAQNVYGRPLEVLAADPDSWKKAIHPDDIAVVEGQFAALFEKGELHCEYRILKPDGEVRWLTDHARVIYGDDAQPLRIDCTLSDITDRKRAEDRLMHEALHDQLTGLPNRALIMNRVELALQRLKRQVVDNFALLFIDFDRFKVINDSLGHLVGDHLLIVCAQGLQSCIRPQDTIARLGGDEFVILLDQIDSLAIAIQIAERIQEHFRAAITIDSHTIFTSASIGIVLGDSTYQQASELLRDADIAMYRAKGNGRARYEVFTPNMRAQALEVLHSGNALRFALETEQLQLYYQPVIALTDHRVIGLETLIRWQHPTLGLLLPDTFIPVALENGLMMPLGAWVLKTACAQISQLKRRYRHLEPLKISLNVSDHLLGSPDFLATLDGIFQETGLSPQSVCFELVEATLMSRNQEIYEVLHQIRNRQVCLAIDDFGTGYSSLSYLHRFPINFLKIDRSFIHQMNENTESFEIVRAIIALAHTLGKDVIAEGIEQAEQVQQLQDLGCRLGQGFFFAKPMPLAAVERLLQERLTLFLRLK
jgi:diguanylate cyclase (GGDEF)-like protein/PAS domain S-box-containing protein